MQLDVWSDIACPWCFLGKRRLARALDGRKDVTVRWRAFELQPGMPAEGGSLAELEKKLGGPERMARAHAHIAKLGADVGITYAFEKRTKLSNTRMAHRAIALAPPEKADALVDALFRAHFEEGRDLSPRETVEEIARSVGVDVTLEGDAGLASVLEDEEMANTLGIGGVPCFVANMRAAVSGAQDVDTLRGFLDDVGAA
jgi:predicted DsbA family dithiol-disulfide isomerase